MERNDGSACTGVSRPVMVAVEAARIRRVYGTGAIQLLCYLTRFALRLIPRSRKASRISSTF
jgi:hypothetical protein